MVVLVAGMGSCGWEADGYSRLEEQYQRDPKAADPGAETTPDPGREDGGRDASEGADTPPIDDLSPGEVSTTSLEGSWIGRLVQQGNITPLFQEWPITTTDWFVGTATGDEITLRLCREVPVVHDEDPEMDFVTRMPDGTALALRERRPLRLRVQGGTLPAQTVLWTWGLADAADDTPGLPTKADDARVEDTDGDGKPGVTMEVVSPVAGFRYLVKRVRFTLSETPVSLDGVWLIGPLEYTIEEQPLGADPSSLKAVTPITPTEGSFFVLRRVSDLDCDALMALGEEAFAGAPSL